MKPSRQEYLGASVVIPLRGKRIISILVACLAAVLALPVSAQLQTAKPNIILVMPDDVGYGDYACLGKLKACGVADNTVIVLWGDHGWHLGEHSIWGKHALFEESLRSPLVIYHPGIEKPGVQARGIVETQDIFPTLCVLVDLEKPQFATGKSLVPLLQNPAGSGHEAVSYLAEAKTIRTDQYRLIVHKSGEVELYDHATPASETKNVADSHPKVVSKLKARLEAKMATRSFVK